ncbi:ERF superfamily protein, partial [Candidatus Regiella insecticola 5.15]
MSKTFYQQVSALQRQLNAPKNQYNTFGKYRYRSCEDILEGIKPLLGDLFLSISDEIVLIGDRYYVKATATLTDGETSIQASALAREERDKKGMDAAQLTGATSSYARKYCLNGLFGIDDAKDADTDAYKQQEERLRQALTPKATRTPAQYLNDFTHWAPQCKDKVALQGAYQRLCQLLIQQPDLAQQAHEIYLTHSATL